MGNTKKGLLNITGLEKIYGDVTAVDDVDFYIPEGSVTGLVGPNGAGKTTMIKCITGFLSYSGDIEMTGISGEEIDKASLGYLAENEEYYPSWTGQGYLRYFAELFNVEDVKKTVSEKLKTAGLYERKDDPIKEYSHGMKKRLGIARTLLHEPKLLIYDEPLSGLDPKIKQDLMEIIEGTAGEGCSVLISSHQLRDIEDACNWIVMIKDGKIDSFGDPLEISRQIGSSKKLVLNIESDESLDLEEITALPDVNKVERKGNTLVVMGTSGKKFEREVFNYLIENDVYFSLKHGSLDAIYQEVSK